MTGNFQVSLDESSVIAFYGIEPTVRGAEEFYRGMVAWFTELGHPPDKLGVIGPGYSGKIVSFARPNARLQKLGFEDVQYCELISSSGDPRGSHDYFLKAEYDADAKKPCAYVVARSTLATLSSRSLLPIAKIMAQQLKPAYGIGYRREQRHGPSWYALGIGYASNIADAVKTGSAYDEGLAVARWGDLGRVEHAYREGLLRDVYPWNFLTEPQLVRPVGSVGLGTWIRQDARRGTLGVLTDGVFLWEVADENIPAVRKALHEADAIFDWRKYIAHEKGRL